MPAAMATTSATPQTLTPLWGSINVWRKRNYTKLMWLKKEKRKSQRCRRITQWMPRLLFCKHLQLICCSIYYLPLQCSYTFIFHTKLTSSTRKRWLQCMADVYKYQKKRRDWYALKIKRYSYNFFFIDTLLSCWHLMYVFSYLLSLKWVSLGKYKTESCECTEKQEKTLYTAALKL